MNKNDDIEMCTAGPGFPGAFAGALVVAGEAGALPVERGEVAALISEHKRKK